MIYGIVVQFNDETGAVETTAGDHIGNIKEIGNFPSRDFQDYLETLEGDISGLKLSLEEKKKTIERAKCEMRAMGALLAKFEKNISD